MQAYVLQVIFYLLYDDPDFKHMRTWWIDSPEIIDAHSAKFESKQGRIPKLIIAMVSPTHQIFNFIKRGFHLKEKWFKRDLWQGRRGWFLSKFIFFFFNFKIFHPWHMRHKKFFRKYSSKLLATLVIFYIHLKTRHPSNYNIRHCRNSFDL